MRKKTHLSIQELILRELKNGPVTAVYLVAMVNKKRGAVTKQAVYAALRKLKEEEKVVLHKKRVSLNSSWVAQMSEFFSVAGQFYRDTRPGDGSFLSLTDGGKISYSFKDPVSTDMFWGHAFRILTETLPENTPVYLYNPHQFFLLARKKQEWPLIKHVRERNCYYLLTAGSNTHLDKSIASYFNNDHMQYHMLKKPLFKKNTYYFNVFGDFVIEAWIDQAIANKIDTYYRKTKRVTSKVERGLLSIMDSQGKTKLVISRNKRKAEKLKRMVKKSFYLPKQRPDY